MVHWTSSINISNHNKIVSVHKYHLGCETNISSHKKIYFSEPRIYYENKKIWKDINCWCIVIYLGYKFCQVKRTLYIKYTLNSILQKLKFFTTVYWKLVLKIQFYLMNLVYKNCLIDNITKLFIIELIKYRNRLIYLIEN